MFFPLLWKIRSVSKNLSSNVETRGMCLLKVVFIIKILVCVLDDLFLRREIRNVGARMGINNKNHWLMKKIFLLIALDVVWVRMYFVLKLLTFSVFSFAQVSGYSVES